MSRVNDIASGDEDDKLECALAKAQETLESPKKKAAADTAETC